MGYIVLGMMVLLGDILTKLAAETGLQRGAVGTVPLWKGVFHLTYVENRGIAFGMFQNMRLVSLALSLVILVILAILYNKTANRSRWMKLGTALVYGGAIGNLLERLAKGYVVDFLDFRLIHFPVFNIADVAVCVGAVCLMVHFCLWDGKKPAPDTAAAETEKTDTAGGADD